MSPQADVSFISAFVGTAGRRVRLIALLQGAAAGLAVAGGVVLSFRFMGHAPSALACLATGLGSGIACALLWATLRRQQVATVVTEVERRAPCNNLVITAAEVLQGRTSVEPGISAILYREAARLTSALDLRALFPARRASAGLGAAVLLFVAASGVSSSRFSLGVAGHVAPDAATIAHIDVLVVPPGYTSDTSIVLHDPSRVIALVGSQIRLIVHGAATSVSLETVNGHAQLRRATDGSFSGTVTADADGYVALAPINAHGASGDRRLIGLTVSADAPPHAVISKPGHDLFVIDGHRTLDVAIDATDDIGVTSLALAYTKVSGSGEDFTFTEGRVPIQIARKDGRHWTATASWALDSLQLGQGDMLVYRAVVTDGRPGAAPVESDGFIVEVLAPGNLPSEGFTADDQMDKYALSEQMVILETERLTAARPSISADSVKQVSSTISAEQRSLRAIFVFMMGGELGEDVSAEADPTQLHEEAEAEGESDLAAGRMANQGRISLVAALRFMSRASSALDTLGLGDALTSERSALTSLQGAFSRTRYILRALSQSEALDLSRRLSGVLKSVLRDAEPQVTATVSAPVVALRSALATTAALSTGMSDTSASAASMLAERILRVDPASPTLQKAAGALSKASSAFANRQASSAQSSLDSAAAMIAGAIRVLLPVTPSDPASPGLDRLGGALVDALHVRQ